MKNLKRSEKILLSVLAFAVVFYVYYTFLLSPVIDKISTSNHNIAGYNQDLNDINLKEAQTVKLKADYETYKTDYEKLVKRFPVFEKDPQIGYDLKILADKSKVTLQSQNYSAANSAESASNTAAANTTNTNTVKKDEKYKLNFVAINMNIGGNYDNIKSFINSLENEERSTVITSVNIAKSDTEITASIVANFYFISDTQNTVKNSYDFNNKNYGKSNFFD
jgi:type IV pilus assembly protein PilO